MNHSTIHVLFAIETMVPAIWRHLFYMRLPAIEHTRAHKSKTNEIKQKNMTLLKVNNVYT